MADTRQDPHRCQHCVGSFHLHFYSAYHPHPHLHPVDSHPPLNHRLPYLAVNPNPDLSLCHPYRPAHPLGYRLQSYQDVTLDSHHGR